jgi:hypothetical protein
MSVKLNFSPKFLETVTNYDAAYRKFPKDEVENAEAAKVEFRNRYLRLVNSPSSITAEKTLNSSLKRKHPEALQKAKEWVEKGAVDESYPNYQSAKRQKNTLSHVINAAEKFKNSKSSASNELVVELKKARKEFKEQLRLELKSHKVDEIEKYMTDKKVSGYVITKMKFLAEKAKG